MRWALLLLAGGCGAAARPHIAEVVSAFDNERAGLRVVISDETLQPGTRWELIDERGAIGEAILGERDPTGFCDDAFCTFYHLRLVKPATLALRSRMVAIGPLDRSLPRARRVVPPPAGLVQAIDLDGDGAIDVEVAKVRADADDVDCFELRERPARVVWRRCHTRHW